MENNTSGFLHDSRAATVTRSIMNDIRGDWIMHNYGPRTSTTDDTPPLPPLKNSSPLFVGREVYLKMLEDHFRPNLTHTSIRKLFLLHGMGGIGKTQICLKFIEENTAWFSQVFWIDAHSESSISLRLKQIAKDNGLSPPSAESALRWLISLDSNWFMVFDNANERYKVIEDFITNGNKGNILITSRNDAIARVTAYASHSVDQMEEKEALSLLSKSSNLESGFSDVARSIVDILGYIPLAIDQAGAYIQQGTFGFDCYLDLYKRHHKGLMSDRWLTGASGGTWDVSMEEIKCRVDSHDKHIAHAAECALPLHGLFAFLDKENVSEDIFENAAANYKHNEITEWKEPYQPLPGYMDNSKVLPLDSNGKLNKMDFYAGIHVLQSFALIKHDGKSYSIHQLVHMWSRDRLSYDATVSNWESARALLALSIKVNQDANNHTFLRMCYSHLCQLVLHL